MTDTKQSAIEAAARAIGLTEGADYTVGNLGIPHDQWEAWKPQAEAAILAYLSAIAEDEASVEAVARAIDEAEGVGPDHIEYDSIAWRTWILSARATLRTLIERAKEEQG